MNVSFHVDFKKDLEGAIEIALDIIPDKKLKQFITLDNRKRFLDTLNKNRFDYDKVKFPSSIDIKYKPIFESNKKVLLKTKDAIERKWSKIENKFLSKLDKFFGKTQKTLRIRCYIIYSYENVAGVSNDELYFKVGYKVSDIQTIAHEIIHIYLNRFRKNSIKSMDNKKHEVLARIIEYRTLPIHTHNLLPHWLAGLTHKEWDVLNNLRTRLDIEKVNLEELITNLNQ